MKKIFKIITVFVLIIILFRGIIYRTLIKYNEIGTRNEVRLTNANLKAIIKSKSINTKMDLKNILKIANEITNEELKFTWEKSTNNPNEVIATHKANCVGYSAMFNSVVNYLIRENALQDKIEAKHKIAHLELIGINVHNHFKSSFFKDHDFNEVINKKTGDKFYIDPSVSDYFGIRRIKTKKKG